MTSSAILDYIEDGFFDIDTIDEMILAILDEDEINEDYDKIPDIK